MEETGKNKNKNKKQFGTGEQIANVFRRFVATSTCHGFPRTINSKETFLKFMWLVFSLTSLGFCIYNIVLSIQAYFQYGVTSTVRVIFHNDMIFPVISICNVNPFTTSQINNYIQQNKLEPNGLLYQSNSPDFNRTLRKSFGFDVSTLIRTCSFNGVNYDLSKLEPFYRSDYGNCFRFNSGRDANGNKINFERVYRGSSGFYFEAFVGPSPNYNNNQSFIANNRGIVVIVDNHENVSPMGEGILLLPGASTKVFITKTDSTTIEYPYSNCVNGDKVNTLIAYEMNRLGLIYSRASCLKLCEQKSTIDQLGCYDLRLPRLFDAPPCDVQTYYNKLLNITYNLSRCFEYCPYECNTVTYGLSSSQSEFPNYEYYKYLLNNDGNFYANMFQTNTITHEMMRDNLTSGFFFFEQLQTVTITESPTITGAILLANIGGTLGLFIGASLLSVSEIFELGINLIRVMCKCYKIEKEETEFTDF